MADVSLAEELALQLSWHWEAQLRPRLQGLTDAEYLWEPVPGCWSIRPGPEGSWVPDFAWPQPEPPPVTTIAWRLSHLVVGVFGDRNARYFGGDPISYETYVYPPGAATSLADLDAQVGRWLSGVRALTAEDLAQHCREPGYEQDSMAGLVLHISREAIHHGAEIALLRDLYLHGAGGRL